MTPLLLLTGLHCNQPEAQALCCCQGAVGQCLRPLEGPATPAQHVLRPQSPCAERTVQRGEVSPPPHSTHQPDLHAQFVWQQARQSLSCSIGLWFTLNAAGHGTRKLLSCLDPPSPSLRQISLSEQVQMIHTHVPDRSLSYGTCTGHPFNIQPSWCARGKTPTVAMGAAHSLTCLLYTVCCSYAVVRNKLALPSTLPSGKSEQDRAPIMCKT
jgi:hypothetical protein